MATSEASALAEATRRVLDMRRVNVSRAKIADAMGVSMDVIRTIERLGARKTRRVARRRILRWMAQGGTSIAAPPPRPPGKRGPGRPPGSGRRRGRPARAGTTRHAARVVPSTGAAVRSADSGMVTLELDGGRVLRLRGGHSYLLRGSVLFEVLSV
jgi:hypothetical protein